MAATDNHSLPHLLIQSMTSLWFHQNVLIKPPPSPTQVNTQSTKNETASATSSASPKKDAKDKDVAAEQFVIKHQLLKLKPASSVTIARSSSLSLGGGMVRQLRRRGKMSSSCKSSWDLEEEELRGFMDLGFSFKEEEVSSHVMQILPALQRLGVEEKRLINRPYLSEAWLINRPDSPLLNLRVPSQSEASMADMKRHLRCWARTVADEIL